MERIDELNAKIDRLRQQNRQLRDAAMLAPK